MSESLSIVGAGFGRTGTKSMKAAIEQLGFGPCHHMVEAFGRPDDFDQWTAAVRGEPWDMDHTLAGFHSTIDFPSSVVWQQLWGANPGSKVLLTVRSSDSWWRSFDATIGPEMRRQDREPEMAAATRLFAAINEMVFDGRSDDREAAITAYERHNRHVIDSVPHDQLCVHEVGSGWGPLCAFLGVEAPDEPFPSTNSTEEFLANRDGGATDIDEPAPGR